MSFVFIYLLRQCRTYSSTRHCRANELMSSPSPSTKANLETPTTNTTLLTPYRHSLTHSHSHTHSLTLERSLISSTPRPRSLASHTPSERLLLRSLWVSSVTLVSLSILVHPTIAEQARRTELPVLELAHTMLPSPPPHIAPHALSLLAPF